MSPLCLLLLAVFLLLLRLHVKEFGLQRSAEGDHHGARVVSIHPLLDFSQPQRREETLLTTWQHIPPSMHLMSHLSSKGLRAKREPIPASFGKWCTVHHCRQPITGHV